MGEVIEQDEILEDEQDETLFVQDRFAVESRALAREIRAESDDDEDEDEDGEIVLTGEDIAAIEALPDEELSEEIIFLLQRHTAQIQKRTGELEAELAPFEEEHRKIQARREEDARVEKFMERCGPAFKAAGATPGAARTFARLHPDVERPHGAHIVNWCREMGLIS